MTSLRLLIQEPERPAPLKRWDRSHGTRRLDEEVSRARREPSYRFSVLLVEFEGLSDYEGRLGYAAEEDIWSRALAFVQEDLTAQDLCCRLTGDEFLLILPHKNHAQACELIECMRGRWRPAPASRESDTRINIGIASYPTHGCTVEQLLCAADEALAADRLRYGIGFDAGDGWESTIGTHH
jgi:diguanylate cyclase (GGDEF)-like protein